MTGEASNEPTPAALLLAVRDRLTDAEVAVINLQQAVTAAQRSGADWTPPVLAQLDQLASTLEDESRQLLLAIWKSVPD